MAQIKYQGAWKVVQPKPPRIIDEGDDFSEEDKEDKEIREAEKRAYRPRFLRYGKKYFPVDKTVLTFKR